MRSYLLSFSGLWACLTHHFLLCEACGTWATTPCLEGSLWSSDTSLLASMHAPHIGSALVPSEAGSPWGPPLRQVASGPGWIPRTSYCSHPASCLPLFQLFSILHIYLGKSNSTFLFFSFQYQSYYCTMLPGISWMRP